MKAFTTAAALIKRLSGQANAMKGRPGVVAARDLRDRILAASHKHHMQMFCDHRRYRSDVQIQRGIAARQAFLEDAAQGYPKASFYRHPTDPAWPMRTLTALQGAGCKEIARIAGWWISTDEEIEEDRNYYSKAWHRAHGPKKTVVSRTVQIRSYDSKTKTVVKLDQVVEGWRGNWALKAVIDAGIVQPVRVSTKLKPIQLHPAFAVIPVRNYGEIEIYRRELAGEIEDYCALWHGLTYHAATPRAAVHGLKTKLNAVTEQRDRPINWKLCRTLGFCEAGIKQFCRDFDLDPAGSYSPDQIRCAIEGDLESAAPYAGELRKLAQAVGYAIPAQLGA